MNMKTTIRKDERGLVFENGNYKKILVPGDYFFILPNSSREIKILKTDQPFTVEGKNLNLFLEDPEFLKEVSIAEVQDHELALHYEDNRFTDILKPGKYAFWHSLKKHSFVMVDTRQAELHKKLDITLFSNPKLANLFYLFDVAAYEKGLLFFNGIFQDTLKSGRYYYWKGSTAVQVINVDMRQQQLDVQGQEIMTLDKVPLRLNFVCHFKIKDAYKAYAEIKDFKEQIYIVLQLILREYVGTQKLDDILVKKEEIGSFVLKQLKEKEAAFGIEFIFAGLKDVILPGEIKEIINTVLIAEKKAQANVIMRREEIASTRSLLNTAKLMDENKTLYKLKELEFLEKICDKIGNISLMGGGTLLEHLTSLMGSDKK